MAGMARIRTLKPEYWQDEKLAPLPVTARLVYLGLISQADDAGRLVDNVRLLDGLLFPATDDTCGPSLTMLANVGVIERGLTASGQHVIQVVGWSKHQRVDHPNLKSVLPPIFARDSREIREDVASGSRTIPTTYDQRPTTNTSAAGRPTKRDVSPEFQTAWQEYPSRLGGNPKHGAWNAWQARIREGVKPADMLAGVKRYAKFCHTTGKMRTEFVMQAKRFFGPEKRYAETWDIPPPEAGKIRPGSEAAAVRQELPRAARPPSSPESVGSIVGRVVA